MTSFSIDKQRDKVNAEWMSRPVDSFKNQPTNQPLALVLTSMAQSPIFAYRLKRKLLSGPIFGEAYIVTVNHRYVNFYFSASELNTEDYIKLIDDNGVYLREDIWRRDELIQMAAPIVMMGYGILYYINFCSQYLDKGKVKDKSEHFEEITTQIVDWLKKKFITKRGANCFDGQEAYDKLIAKRNGERQNASC